MKGKEIAERIIEAGENGILTIDENSTKLFSVKGYRLAQAYLDLLKEMEGGWMKMPGLWSYRTGWLMFRWKWMRDLYDYCQRKTNDY